LLLAALGAIYQELYQSDNLENSKKKEIALTQVLIGQAM
jgi:hypothetical protein